MVHVYTGGFFFNTGGCSMSYNDSGENVSRNRLDRFNIQSLFGGVVFKIYFPQPEIFFTEENEKQLEKKTVFYESGATQLENVGTQSEPQNPKSSKDTHTGLTQEFQNVSVKEFFHVAPGRVLFLPDTADKLYRVEVLENCDHFFKTRYLGWGPENNACSNSQSNWAYSKNKEQLSSRHKISTDISNKIDNIFVSCDSSQLNNSYSESAHLSIKSESKKLPEKLTILSSYMPTCRFAPIKFRAKRSQLLSIFFLIVLRLQTSRHNGKAFRVFKMRFTCL